MRTDALLVSLLGNNKPSQATWENVRLPPSSDSFPSTNYNSIDNLILQGGKTLSGEWVDVVVFENWLKWAIQTQVFALFKRVSKPSILQIENSINTALEAGRQLGGIVRYKVTAVDVDTRNRTASFEWKAQLTNAIHSTTITGIVTP